MNDDLLMKVSDFRRMEDRYRKEIKAKNKRINTLEKDNKELRAMCEKLHSRIGQLTDRINDDQSKMIDKITDQQEFITEQQKLLFDLKMKT